MTDKIDVELLERAKTGDISAYEGLVKKYETKLYWYLRNWTKDDDLVEDVVQETLVKIYINLKKIDPQKGFRTYVYKISRNLLIDKFRQNKQTLTLLETVVGDDGEYLYEEIHKKDNQAMVKKALDLLKVSQRKVLELYYFEQMSYLKISEKMGVPINTIKTNIRRAKTSLAKVLRHEKK